MAPDERYPNDEPGVYTLHIRFAADSDAEALQFGATLHGAASLTAGEIVEGFSVTDADDWAETVSGVCETDGCAATEGLTRSGVGARLCRHHATERNGRRLPEPVGR